MGHLQIREQNRTRTHAVCSLGLSALTLACLPAFSHTVHKWEPTVCVSF